jgi:hypothetical protein
MTRITQDLVSIPATLVRLKWQNRREIYPLQVKEEIYGAVINAIIEQRPELKEKLWDGWRPIISICLPEKSPPCA